MTHPPALREPLVRLDSVRGGTGAGVCLGPGAWHDWRLLVSVSLVGAVLTAVHHAEVVAHRVGEPFGTLILALAVTVIEAALVVSMILSGGAGAAAIARDTVYAAVMIVCNGVVGLCLLLGGLRHHVLAFRVDGTSPALSVLAALSMLVLVLPGFTTTTRDRPTRHHSSRSPV